jgi:hypothetical protein
MATLDADDVKAVATELAKIIAPQVAAPDPAPAAPEPTEPAPTEPTATTTLVDGVPVANTAANAAPAEPDPVAAVETEAAAVVDDVKAVETDAKEPISDLLDRLRLEHTAQNAESIIRWITERGAELLGKI